MIDHSSRTGFTRTDLLAAIVLSTLVLIYGVALTGCGGLLGESSTSSARRTARQMQNATQIRGIQQGMVLYAVSNKTYYPGLDSNGENVAAQQRSIQPDRYGAAAFDGANPTAAVYAVLLTGYYYTPEYAISPVAGESGKVKADLHSPVTKANYSYALLSVADKVADRGRRVEWSDTQNSQAPIAGDRSKAIDPSLSTTSIHVSSKTTDSADWQGSIVWNDNHVTFETTGKLRASALKFGSVYDDRSTDTDDLFSGAAVGKFDETTNALFAY